MNTQPTTHELDKAYTARLGRAMRKRMKRGASIEEALLETLQERTPLLLRQADRRSGSSIWGKLARIGLVAGAGCAVIYAVQKMTGGSATDRVTREDEADYGTADSSSARHVKFENVATADERYARHAEQFRSHYEERFGDTGEAYDSYQPAYRHGYRFGAAEEYREQAYADLSAQMKKDFDARQREGSFADVEDAMRYGFEQGRMHIEDAQVGEPTGSSHTASGDSGSSVRKGGESPDRSR